MKRTAREEIHNEEQRTEHGNPETGQRRRDAGIRRPVIVDNPKELETQLKRKLEEQRKEFETLFQELMNKINGGAADDLGEVKKLDRSELDELFRRKFEEAV